MSSIGFIGLGTMGYPMALNLATKMPKVMLYVNDDILITIVPEGSHVRQVYLDEMNGVIAANLNNKILIDCSTIDTETSAHVAAEIRTQDQTASFYDAPISGGSLGAENATLTFMVGCSELDASWPTLDKLLGLMGTSIFACGAPTLGLTAKLSNNYCSALIALATAEAMNIGMKAGMDPRVLATIFSKSTAQSTICDKWCPVPGVVPTAPSSHGYKGGFKVQLMKKDFTLAMAAANLVEAKTYLGGVGLGVYSAAAEDPKCRDLDSRVVFRFIGGNEHWAESTHSSGQLSHYIIDDFTDPWKKSDVVLIQHGFGRTVHHWYHWVPALARRYVVIRRDLRGHGLSTCPKATDNYDYSLETILAEIIDMLDQLRIDKVHFLGESTSGMLGEALAVRFPHRLHSLVICSSPTHLPPPALEFFAFGHADWPTACRKLGSRGWAEVLSKEPGTGPTADLGYKAWWLREIAKSSGEGLAGYAEFLSRLDARPFLKGIKIPVLILAPNDSAVMTVEAMEDVARQIEGSILQVVRAQGHEIYVTGADECQEAVLEFWASLK
ncbi:putative alpha/beta fold family hydrolase [Microdochium bolleyi]|uniref:3-hydroxyisobutyrate dehydrogenase n=1 Tax=Microdochium bolleyi TaxID=196109 RepID=A0A136ISM6_9PEZI|nr:putative alpha/beta fold family hydrolase [Microdochium bolleyi]